MSPTAAAAAPPGPPPVTAQDAAAGAVRVKRRAEVALFEAWCDLRGTRGHWTSRERAVLRLRLSDREAAALDRVTDRRGMLPECVAAFRHGVIGWDDLVSITYATGRVSGDALARVDREVAAHARLLVAEDRWPGELLEHCERLVREARELRSVEISEEAAQSTSRVIVQPRLDGGGTLIADLDPVLFADVATALDEAADRPSGDRPRGADRAEALGAICRDRLTGGDHSRTSVNVVVDLTDAADPRTLGVLLRRATGNRAPRLSALAVETLACDATVTAILTDGARPLAELRLQDAIPAAVRRAVVARDRGCRFPACRMPATWSDVHHLQHRAEGGDHDPDNLLVLCRKHHRRLHRPRWRTQFDPTTARLRVIAPDGTTSTSTPAGHRPRTATVPAEVRAHR